MSNRENQSLQILKYHSYFSDSFKLYEIKTKIGARNFKFLQFDAKQLNRGIKYSLKIRNFQYL